VTCKDKIVCGFDWFASQCFKICEVSINFSISPNEKNLGLSSLVLFLPIDRAVRFVSLAALKDTVSIPQPFICRFFDEQNGKPARFSKPVRF